MPRCQSRTRLAISRSRLWDRRRAVDSRVSVDDFRYHWRVGREFQPAIPAKEANGRYARWPMPSSGHWIGPVRRPNRRPDLSRNRHRATWFHPCSHFYSISWVIERPVRNASDRADASGATTQDFENFGTSVRPVSGRAQPGNRQNRRDVAYLLDRIARYYPGELKPVVDDRSRSTETA